MADEIPKEPGAAPQSRHQPIDGGAAWHVGELTLQEKAGVRQLMERQIANIRDHLIEQHRLFFPLLPSIVIGAVDGQGDVWATIREGLPGFVAIPDSRTVELGARVDTSDPAEAGLAVGKAIGLLGIELSTRRRNRVNGIVSQRQGAGLRVAVEESFGNCPQYIQLRNFTFARDPQTNWPSLRLESGVLDESHRALITSADTFFVASYIDRESRRQVDVSHRGGKAGFVRVDVDGSLTIPDFAGNLFFNTLGNILVNGRAGVCFPNFDTGALLQISGQAEVILDSPEIGLFQGAERLWRLIPERVVFRPDALALRWSKVEGGESPNGVRTGDWREVSRRRQAELQAARWRPFRVVRRVEESSSISSFYLQPADGEALIHHEAGQYLPIQLQPPNGGRPLLRNYTISAAPSDSGYRLSIKKDGVASSFIHDNVHVGALIEARAPGGNFTLLPEGKRPSVLIAAGVGITPMIAMLRHRLYERNGTRAHKPMWLFYGARTKNERAFDAELASMVAQGHGWLKFVRTLSDPRQARQTVDYDHAGWLDAALVKKCLPSLRCDFYLCGPPGFMQDVYDGLRALGVPDQRIFAETFGPAALRRTRPRRASIDLAPPSSRPVRVRFEKSGIDAVWAPGSGTLLDLAESVGLAPDFNCRIGKCGTCSVGLVKGSVTYDSEPEFDVRARACLLCRAVPAQSASTSDDGVSVHA